MCSNLEQTMIIYTELTKLEPQPDGSIKVYGVASTGARDTAGEVVSPDAMRAALPDYLAFGAIREMHEPRAAGAALSAEVDAAGVTRIAAHIVDPVAVTKVKAGVYKGLSIGGRVLGRDANDRTLITALRLDEISLVDRPCNPEAVIDLWKSACFETPAEPVLGPSGAWTRGRAPQHDEGGQGSNTNVRHAEERGDRAASRSTHPTPPPAHQQTGPDTAPHGSFADPLAAKYPLNTAERIRAAWSSITAPQNRAGYTDDEIAAMEARIIAAWRAKIDPAGPPATAPTSEKLQPVEDLRKLADLEAALAGAHVETARLNKLLADAQPERDALTKRLTDASAEIERLRRQPLPRRTAGGHLAKAVSKEEDAGGSAPLSPDQITRALDAMPASDRAHLLMKAALSRPIAM